jgi:hypothetical protein
MALWDLRCAVPNEGAHRLAWVLGLRPDPLAAVTRLEVMIGVNVVERLLRGEIEPSWTMGARIELFSGGEVTTRMFYRPANRRWYDAPAGLRLPKQLLKKAA